MHTLQKSQNNEKDWNMYEICMKSKPILMPCPYTGPKMFCAGPNFLVQTKNWVAISTAPKDFVPAQKLNLLNIIK